MALDFNARTGVITATTFSGAVTGDATGLSATLVETSGGTNQTTYTTGDILYASAANTLSKLTAGTDTFVLTAGGAGVAPSWAAPASVSLTPWTSNIDGDGNSLFDVGTIELRNANGPVVLNEAATVTNPTLVPDRTAASTGIGAAASGQLSLISVSVEGARYTTASGSVLESHEANVAQVADVGSAQGNGVITSSYNTYGTVGTAGDAATLPATFALGTLIYVKNDAAANSMDVFPASGDTIEGLSTNLPEAIPASEGALYMATLADTTWTKIADTGAGGNVSNTGTPVNNQLAVWTDATTVEGDANLSWDGTILLAGGVLQLTERADHTASPAGGRGEIWVKSGSLGGELMYTEGDSDNDFTAYNVIETTFHHDQTITSADPGAGNMRWDSLTPASVTEIYLNDTDETGRDASFLLSNLAVGDVLTMRSMWSDIDYFVATVDAATTDNTGWWTIPVAPIHTNSVPTTGDPMHITVDWLSQGGTVTSSGSPLNNEVAVFTSGTDIDSSSAFTYNGTSMGVNRISCPILDDQATGAILIRGMNETEAGLTLEDGMSLRFSDRAEANEIYMQNTGVGGGSGQLEISSDSIGAVYFNNLPVRFTESGGVDYIDIRHDGTNGVIKSVGTAADLRLQVNNTELAMLCNVNGSVVLYWNGVSAVATQELGATGVTSGFNIKDHAGNLHDVGFNDLAIVNDNVSDTLEAIHAGGVAFKDTTTARTLTLASNVDLDFPVECMTTVINAFTSTDYTITEGASTTLYYLDGATRTDTAGGCTVGPGGVANIWRESATVYHIWGTGITA